MQAAAATWVRSALATTTVRQFGRAAGVAALAIGAGCGIYAIEKYLFAVRHRFIENPSDVMMRAFALAHFLIGWLFLVTSPRIRAARNLASVAAAAALGVGLCLLFQRFGGTDNPLLIMLFWGYFLIHESRDQRELYQAYGDAPTRAQAEIGQGAVLTALSHAAMLWFMLTLAAGYLLYASLDGKRTTLEQIPLAIPLAVLAVLGLGSALAFYNFRRSAHAHYGSWRTALAVHAPLMAVYAAIFLVLLVGAPFGSAGFNLIILLHVTSWLVFVGYQLGQRPVVGRGCWHWLRRTPVGFVCLHIGLVVLILVFMALRSYTWGKVGFVSELLASSSFVYWGLMHISIAFAPAK